MFANSDRCGEASLDVTVIICTYNRSATLADTLASVAASQMAASTTWEVLVVDNNSTDETRQVANGFCLKFPERFRYHSEAKQGLSHARNAGIANSRGEVLVFTDDDVIVEPTWLKNLTAELRNGEWAGAGGRILPAAGFLPPAWLSPRNFGPLYGHFDLGDEAGELTCPPYGGNMAFVRGAFARHGVFRIDLGRNPNDTMTSEDTEFGRRLIKAGERLRYEPSAVVYHPILPVRLTKKYFCAWWFGFGRSEVRELGEPMHPEGVPRQYVELLRYALRTGRAARRWMFAKQPQDRAWHRCQTWRWVGSLAEILHLSGRKQIVTSTVGHEAPRVSVAKARYGRG